MSTADDPDEMLTAAAVGRARRKLLSLAGKTIETPHYVAATSRGIVPHLSPDVLTKHTRISAAYFGLEDFVEKSVQNAPLLNSPRNSIGSEGSSLKKFTGLPDRIATFLGTRRVPRVQCPAQATDKATPICTSVGFRTLTSAEYLDAARHIDADVIVSMADIADTETISRKRMEKMVDRTHSWFTEATKRVASEETSPLLLPPILPLDNVQQQLYLADLAEQEGSLTAVALYQPQTAAVLPPNLSRPLRFCISDPRTPHDLLKALSLGVDLITTPFVTAVTERGIAFSFTFRRSEASAKLPLGIDMWSTLHAASAVPLSADCACYACTRHHRAYVHHLLQAKEMLAWSLLQIHNFMVLDCFFREIRESIEAGTFEADARAFAARYEDDFILGDGEERGPRMRGYQMRSAGRGEDKKREKVWGRFQDSAVTSGTNSPGIGGVENDQVRKVIEAEESGAADRGGESGLTADAIEQHGLAEKAHS